MRYIVDNRPPLWMWFLAAALILALAPIVIAHSEPYVALTDDQAIRYDLRVLLGHDPSADELAAFVERYPGAVAMGRETIKLDWIEHTTPTVAVPGMVAVLKGRDLVWGWDPSILVVTVPGPAVGEPPALEYDVTLKGGESPAFAPVDRSAQVLLWQIVAVVGTVGGVLAGAAIK